MMPGLQPADHLVFDRQVGLELFAQRLADSQREQSLIVRQPVEKKNSIGDLLGVLHFLERLFARVFSQFGESPIGLHLRMQEILVDRREFARQLLVEQFQNVGIPLHHRS